MVRNAAEQGDVEAQTKLGVMYEFGNGVEHNFNEAVKWYTKAAKKGYAPAQKNLGTMYYSGRGVGKDYKEAIKWFIKSADQGYSQSEYILGLIYSNHNDVEHDYNKAVYWLTKSAEHDNVDAQFNLALLISNMLDKDDYHDDEDEVDDDSYVEVDNKNIDTDDIVKGWLYDFKNSERLRQYEIGEIVKWYTKAAEQGHVGAQFKLGVLLLKRSESQSLLKTSYVEGGDSRDQDQKNGLIWYAKAAENGYIAAQYGLGNMYHDGFFLEQDFEKSRLWYMYAANQGHMDAQYKLGRLYENGEGVERNYKEAVAWYSKAAMQGLVHAQTKLGSFYTRGRRGVPKNENEAVKWYTKAAEQGNGLGINFLAKLAHGDKPIPKKASYVDIPLVNNGHQTSRAAAFISSLKHSRKRAGG